ncbi:hypothetical protein QCA50_019649 [Cerrena zonata]|uniref:Putative ER transporter 6TM N-terminal domain-containing protein n=1 Tax=Cerrena zonata TaxID=2478898 RepID=A0AAW0FGQ4_9APHY
MAMVIVLGLCVGWAIAAAGMAAALAARDQVALQQSLQREQQSVAGLSNPEALFQADIFQGNFLDTRSTVVYGVFLGFGVFIFALIRAYAPKLTLMSIFGTIAIDIYCVGYSLHVTANTISLSFSRRAMAHSSHSHNIPSLTLS